jgi:hypothetical protein
VSRGKWPACGDFNVGSTNLQGFQAPGKHNKGVGKGAGRVRDGIHRIALPLCRGVAASSIESPVWECIISLQEESGKEVLR